MKFDERIGCNSQYAYKYTQVFVFSSLIECFLCIVPAIYIIIILFLHQTLVYFIGLNLYLTLQTPEVQSEPLQKLLTRSI